MTRNSEVVEAFMQNLCELYDIYKFYPTCMFAGYKTGVTTATDSPTIIAQRGTTQLISAATGEIGYMVTITTAAPVAERAIPPMYIFSRMKYNDLRVQHGPPGPSMWQDAYVFLKIHETCKISINATRETDFFSPWITFSPI